MGKRLDIKVFVGIAFIFAGLFMFAENLGFYFPFDLFDLWPLIIVAVGVNFIAKPEEQRQVFTGLIFIGVGALFLLDSLNILYFSFSDLWPLIIIFVGFAILKERKKPAEHSEESTEYDGVNHIHLSYILGGGDQIYTSKQLTGGDVSAILGGGTIDIRQAGWEGETLTINVFTFMGGVTILVPPQCQVVIQGNPILGAMENLTRPIHNIEGLEVNPTPKKVVVRGSAILSGVEIKN